MADCIEAVGLLMDVEILLARTVRRGVRRERRDGESSICFSSASFCVALRNGSWKTLWFLNGISDSLSGGVIRTNFSGSAAVKCAVKISTTTVQIQ